MNTVIDVAFIIIWTIFPIIWYFALKFSKLSIFKLTLPSFVVLFIFIFQYLGYPILYWQLDEYRAEFVTNKTIVVQALIITSITTLSFCFGSFLANKSLGDLTFFKEKIAYKKPLLDNFNNRIVFIACFCLYVLYDYVSKIGLNNLAIFVAINASSVDAAMARSEMGNNFDGSYHWHNVFMREVLIFTSLYFFAFNWLSSKKKSIIFPFISFTAVCFSLTMATEKGLFADYLIVLMLLHTLANKNGIISAGNVLILNISLVAVLIVFYMIFMGDNTVIAGFNSIISRALSGSIQPAYHYLEFFPDHSDWLLGASFPNPGGLLPFIPFNLTVELMNFVFPEHLSTGIVGSMPAIYWGEIYANFGLIGLTIIPPLLGFSLYLINWLVFKLHFDPLNISLFAWMLIHYKNLSITGISMFVVDFNLIIILVIYFIARFNFKL